MPFALVLVGYAFAASLNGGYRGSYAQGLPNDLGFALHVVEPAAFDRWLGPLPTAWLQEHLNGSGRARWYDAVVAVVYVSHFVVGPTVAAVLWFRNRARCLAWAGCLLAMAVLGLATYIGYPMAPPWLAAEIDVTGPIKRISGMGWEYVHLDAVSSLLQSSQASSNPVAAMPSLHAGYAALCAAFFVRRTGLLRNVLLVGYPVLMGFAVVYTGEHYVIDVIVGAAYAVLVVAAARLIPAEPLEAASARVSTTVRGRGRKYRRRCA